MTKHSEQAQRQPSPFAAQIMISDDDDDDDNNNNNNKQTSKPRQTSTPGNGLLRFALDG